MVVDLKAQKKQALIQNIDESPTDIVFGRGEVFVSTGRGGTIQVRMTESFDQIHREVTASSRWQYLFSPTRIRLHPDGMTLWMSSYNLLFSCPVDATTVETPPIETTSQRDCVNDFDFSADGSKVFATCTYSNRLAVIDVKSARVIDYITEVRQPARIRVIGERAYVMGLTNERLSLISLSK